MSNILTYKGYLGSAKYSPEDCVFHGKLKMIPHLITFEADSEAQLQLAFEDAIENYLAFLVEASLLPSQ